MSSYFSPFQSVSATDGASSDAPTLVFASPPTGTPEELGDYLTDGYWHDNGASRRYFDTSSSNVITVNLSGLTAREKKLARAALEAWEMVADIEFLETNSSSADIVFVNDDNGNSSSLSAYSYSYTSGSHITSSVVFVSTGWIDAYGDEIGSYGFQTYVHELGHALGLGHQSYYNGIASYPNSADFANDSWQMSIMSYFDQDINTSVDASYALVISPMIADIIAIQDLYGAAASGSPTAGDTIWGQDANLGNYLNDVLTDIANGTVTSYSGDPITFTIYDASGTDIIDLSFSTTNDTLDMRDGKFSDVLGGVGNVGIAVGTVIENLNAGSGNDTITGNSVANKIDAGAGNDTVYGGNGKDTISGGDGSDKLNGQGGIDRIHGDAGKDTIKSGGNSDYAYGGTGNDTVYGENGNDRLYGQDGSDTLYGGKGSDRSYGGNGDDTIYGNSGTDTLRGGDGIDMLYGGDGVDTIKGDDGSDRIYGQDGYDTIYDGNGNDRIYGGNGNDQIYIESGNDTVFGNAGADNFIFNENSGGNDTIKDFEVGVDTITFDSSASGYISSGMDGSDVIDTYGSTSGGNTILTFDDGPVIVIEGIVDSSDLDGSIFVNV